MKTTDSCHHYLYSNDSIFLKNKLTAGVLLVGADACAAVWSGACAGVGIGACAGAIGAFGTFG